MRRVIWRTISSMCLSLIDTPWSRYTFWTSSTRYSLRLADALDLHDLLRVEGTVGDRVAGLDVLAVGDDRPRLPVGRTTWCSSPWSSITVTGMPLPSSSPMRTHAAGLGQAGRATRRASLEQLDDARQTAGDVLAGDTTGVERPHRQLRAGLADRLGGDDADSLAELDRLAGGQRTAVAHGADAELGIAREHRADADPVDLRDRRAARPSRRRR